MVLNGSLPGREVECPLDLHPFRQRHSVLWCLPSKPPLSLPSLPSLLWPFLSFLELSAFWSSIRLPVTDVADVGHPLLGEGVNFSGPPDEIRWRGQSLSTWQDLKCRTLSYLCKTFMALTQTFKLNSFSPILQRQSGERIPYWIFQVKIR